MKDIFKEPVFYYIAVPIVIVIWPLLVWQVYLPRTAKNWQAEEEKFHEAQDVMKQILDLDRERLDFKDAKGKDKFDYTVAVDTAARKVGVPSANYAISSKPIRGSGRNKTQECQINIHEVDIVRFSRFLSNIQTTWASLQCEKVTLTKKKGLPDAWKADVTFKYYY
jgi:hypothetical protein